MSHHFSKEIQGLRALAVASVVIYHVWPKLLPGGYVGVDVFFVISGYLITRILLREAESSNTISLSKFYARRINRLLPAAAAVIFISSSFYWMLPSLQWMSTVKQGLSSTFYIQNWFLAIQAIDYLDAEKAAGVFQHFWSLSVEEQFYIAWPIIILASIFLGTKSNFKATNVTRATIYFLCLAGFVYSVTITVSNPSWAYFSTATRAWELAIGGCIASASYSHSQRLNISISVAGLIGILYACVAYDHETLFPGYMALVPTAGTAMVIWSNQSGYQHAYMKALRLKTMQYLGAISYSLYLWHWPLIIFYRNTINDKIGWLDGAAIILVSIFLAHLSKKHIEDRFRKGNGRSAIKIIVICSLLPIAWLIIVNAHLEVMNTKANEQFSTLNISPSQARKDLPVTYKLKCHSSQASQKVIPCVFGNSTKDISIAIIGDSHAAQWVPALRALSKKNNIKLTSYTKSACNISNNIIYNKGARYESCEQWRDSLIQTLIDTKPSLILIAQSRTYKPLDTKNEQDRVDSLVNGIVDITNRLAKQNLKYILLMDTPRLKKDIPVCLSDSPASYSTCDSAKNKIIDPIQVAAQKHGLPAINMNKYICSDERCSAVKQNIIVWRDTHHITASFSKTLAENLWKELLKLEPALSTYSEQ